MTQGKEIVATGKRSAPEPIFPVSDQVSTDSQPSSPQWRVVPTIVQILQAADSEPSNSCPIDRVSRSDAQAERQWQGAIAALNQLLNCAFPAQQNDHAADSNSLQGLRADSLHAAPFNVSGHDSAAVSSQDSLQGILLSGPAAILDLDQPICATWVFAPAMAQMLKACLRLPPASSQAALPESHLCPDALVVPLLTDDPLSQESFCLVLTECFGLAMAVGRNPSGNLNFYFSFDPEVIQQCYAVLRPRLALTAPHHRPQVDRLARRFAPPTPDYRLVSQFSRWLLKFMPVEVAGPRSSTHSAGSSRSHYRKNLDLKPHASARSASLPDKSNVDASSLSRAGEISTSGQDQGDVHLLRALAHEIRTPLATIRTLTRSLLRRRDLAPEVIHRLQNIDRECNEQIDRFGLIFQAAELETRSPQTAARPLATVSLAEVFQASIPRWQEQAHQSNLKLDVRLPANMPRVVSDPAMLDQVLTSLIDRFTHNLPTGGHIQMQVTLAGSQIKLQFQTQPNAGPVPPSTNVKSEPQSIGQLLMVQPETGGLSLNLAVTKNLFHALGGKLIVRQRGHGEVLTVFLPLDQGGEIYTV